MRVLERLALWPTFERRIVAGLVAITVLALGAGAGTGSTSASSTPRVSRAVGGSLTVWVDSVRLPAAKAYVKAHKNVKVKIVTFDGDGNGATTMQTKIQLWNRTGSGWPDVAFSEQVNDPVWMAQKPFNFAAPLNKGLIPQSLLKKWPGPSTAQCKVNGTQYCVQDNLAQVVLWVNKKLMNKFGYSTPKSWQQWAALGKKVATEHPGYIVGNIGDSYGHWIYLWGNKCPLEKLQRSRLLINATDAHCTQMANLLDPLIKDGALPPLSVFTPDFATKYGGADDKILMMPGPTWYGHGLFDQTLHVPSGEMTAAMPLRWGNSKTITTGQVGGGPWIISRHSKNLKAAADFVIWATTSHIQDKAPGYPAYQPAAVRWLKNVAKDSYFASNPTPAMKAAANKVWKGWSIVTYPDQPVWSNTVVTQLVAGKSLSSQLQPFGDALAQAAQASGYSVIRH